MDSLTVVFADGGTMPALGTSAAAILAGLVALFVVAIVAAWLTVRHIPNQQVGVVEKLWSRLGSVSEGRIIALDGEAGYQADLLRGGLHFGLWRWQYRIHKVPLVTIPQGKIGYIYARDGEPLPPSQTLGRVVESNNFQDARAFLGADEDKETRRQGDKEQEALADAFRGQRGRQRAILREGVYAINLALFVVISEERVYWPKFVQASREASAIVQWHNELVELDGFKPVVIGEPVEA